jgi:co-chaperonin GroES (HSP10)
MTIQTSSNLNQEVPKIKLGLQDKYNEESKQEETKAPTKEALTPENIQGVVDELPEPSGWRILVLPFTPKEKTKGGLIIAQESLDRLRIATNCGYVLKMGPLAYKDKDKFDKPWCKERRLGDFRTLRGITITNRRRRNPNSQRRRSFRNYTRS